MVNVGAHTPEQGRLAQDFVRFAVEAGVLRFGEFKTKAGRLSPYFFNAGLFDDGDKLGRLAEFYAKALLASGIGCGLTNLDQAQENVLRVRAAIGSRQNEIDALANAGEDLNLNYAATLSRLRDVDYAEAITRLTQEQSYLEAAQKSFLQVTGLSLFNYV